MYKEILEILYDYLIAKSTDFALLIDGRWGTGKTYFIRHHFLRFLRRMRYSHIYVSLNGLEDAQKIINRVFYKKIMAKRLEGNFWTRIFRRGKNKSLPSYIAASLVDLILEMDVSILKFFNVSKRHIFNRHVFTFEKTIIIFDDLERISPRLNIKEVLGQIFDNFIDKGIKTVVVGDISRLEDPKRFYEIREKVFRRSVYFAPDFEKLFWNFIENRYGKMEIINFLKNNYKAIKDFFKENEDNLRTVAFCIDQFKKLYNIRRKYRQLAENKVDIFFSLSILGLEFKANRLTDDNLHKLKHLSSENPMISSKYAKDDYVSFFKKKYLNNDDYRFFYLESIKNYVVNGLLKSKKIAQEVEEIISKYDSKEERRLKKMSRFYELEIRDLKEICRHVMKSTKSGKYSYEKYPYIYTLIKHIQKRGYLDNFEFIEFEDLLSGLDISINKTNSDEITADDTYVKSPEVFDPEFKDDLFRILENKIKKIKEENYENYVKNGLLELIEQANQSANNLRPDKNTREIHKNLLEYLEKFKLYQHLLKLNNKGIFWLELYLHSNYNTAEKLTETNKKLLEKLKSFFSTQVVLNQLEFDKMRLTRMQDVVNLIDSIIGY